MNDGASCAVNTCQGFNCAAFGLYLPRPASTTCRNWPCGRDECCYSQDVFCLDANSNIKECTHGRVPKAGYGQIKCQNQECTELQCCDETCASSSTDLCGQRPKNMAAQSHICNNQQGCIADECCLQTCLTSPVPCGATAVAKENPGGIVCASLTCQRSECCQDLCKSISCNTGYYMPNENKVCDAGTCSQGECCARTTCAMTSSLRPYSCPAGYQPKMTPADQIYCGGECTLDTCCDQVKCPVSYQCASGYTPKHDMTNQLCPQTQCRNQDCCKLACSGWFTLNACPAGTRSRLSAAMPEIPCSGGVCTASVCCQENTCVNTAFNCAPPNWLQRSDYSTVKCSSGPSCTEADCCVKTFNLVMFKWIHIQNESPINFMRFIMW